MYSYIARRLAFGALTVIGVSIMVFVVMRILPGDPLVAIFGPEGFTKLSDKERAGYMAALGLSDPLWVQYLAWVKDILRGDFGHSFFRSESVADMILRRIEHPDEEQGSLTMAPRLVVRGSSAGPRRRRSARRAKPA